jgi:predicted RNA-binding Zn-ribbon protein involved in translation (DUF1610 family)
MALKEPESMNECLYFTNRLSPDGSYIRAWALKTECPKCKKALMGKPINEKTGKPKIRSTEYECPNCKYTEEKEEHETRLEVQVAYKCPTCQHEGETTTEYKRKTWQGVKAYVFLCQGCGAKIGITKKMKDPKSKKKKQ